MDTPKLVLTFVAGLVMGGAALYLTPSPTEGPGGGMPGQPGAIPPGSQPGMAPMGTPGTAPMGAQDRAPLGEGAGGPGAGGPSEPQPLPDAALTAPAPLPAIDPSAPPSTIPPLTEDDAVAGAAPPPTTAPEEPQAVAPPVINDAAAAAAAGVRQAPMLGTVALDEHLATAEAKWSKLAMEFEASSSPNFHTLAAEARRVAALVPDFQQSFPPLQDVVILLVEERLLIDRIRASGGDTRELGREVDAVLTRNVGKIPGGAQLRAEQNMRPTTP